jgi:hypothetical protein
MDHLVVPSVDDRTHFVLDRERNRKSILFKEVAKYSGDGDVELENIANGHLKAFEAFNCPGDRLEDMAKLL